MTIPARPTLENMFQFPVFCFSEDGSSHFAPNRWNDDPQWNTHIFWAGLRRWRKQSTVYSILFSIILFETIQPFLGVHHSKHMFVRYFLNISQTEPRFRRQKRQDMGTLVFRFRQTNPIDLFHKVVFWCILSNCVNIIQYLHVVG